MSDVKVTYKKNFDGWNVKKKDINSNGYNPPMFKERDVWWVSVGINVGFEEDGKHEKFIRPVLVVKKFNRMLFLGVPMSTKLKDNRYYLPVTIKDKTVSVLISQIRVFSTLRMQDKLGELDKNDYKRIIIDLREKLFSLPSHC